MASITLAWKTATPFLFLLIAALIWAYLRYAAAPSGAAWALVCLLAVALIWTNYFAWILVALLGVEGSWIAIAHSEQPAAQRLAIAAAVLLLASVPLRRGLLEYSRASPYRLAPLSARER